MKCLFVGIDAADYNILEKFNMPFIKRLISKSNLYNVTLYDLWSRGWAEIISGEHGSQNGALYARYEKSKTKTSSFFGIQDYEKNKNNFWKFFNDRGYKVGLLNIPTVFPAPKLDGFAVSGGGGGSGNLTSKIIEENMNFPKDINLNELNNKKPYVRDIRFSKLKKKNFNNLFEQLSKMDENHIEVFIKLSSKYPIDVGFLVINIELLEIVLDGLLGTHRLFQPLLGDFYSVIINVFEFFAVTVLFACVIFLIRRLSGSISRFNNIVKLCVSPQ